MSRKLKAESRSEEDFDFLSIISNKSKSSNNYFKSRDREIYPDQTSFKKVKTLSFNEMDSQESHIEDVPLSFPRNGRKLARNINTPKTFNCQNFTKLLQEIKEAIISSDDLLTLIPQLNTSLENMKKILMPLMISFCQKNGNLLEAILSYLKKEYEEEIEMQPHIVNLQCHLSVIKDKIYSEVLYSPLNFSTLITQTFCLQSNPSSLPTCLIRMLKRALFLTTAKKPRARQRKPRIVDLVIKVK